jgi:hypothetical protein
MFHDQVAIVTGAGSGLGRAHAKALAAHGAAVIVNDVGATLDGAGHSGDAAAAVVAEIVAAGGTAVASSASVTDEDAVTQMVDDTMSRFGRIDVLINNAGILRDRSFAKMTAEDFRAVMEVHVMGAFHCTHAVWPVMQAQSYGRILMTTSSSGLYGNFGQANYGAAKMALVGLMNTLHLEGAKYDIRVNALSPVAATRMTESVMPAPMLEMLSPQHVCAVALWLVSEAAPAKMIAEAGAGALARAYVLESDATVPAGAQESLDELADAYNILVPVTDSPPPASGAEQTGKMLMSAAAAAGYDLEDLVR